MTTFVPRGRSIWNNKQGWTCNPLPPLSRGDIAVTVQVNNGIRQSLMQQLLENAGLGYEVHYVGENHPRLPEETTLVYLVKLCYSYRELLEVIGVLQSLNIPANSISVITQHLQESLKQYEAIPTV